MSIQIIRNKNNEVTKVIDNRRTRFVGDTMCFNSVRVAKEGPHYSKHSLARHLRQRTN